MGLCLLDRPWLAVYEFMQYGDVRNVFQAAKEKKIPVTKAEQVFLANQLASGLQHIHSKVASLVLTESTLLNCVPRVL